MTLLCSFGSRPLIQCARSAGWLLLTACIACSSGTTGGNTPEGGASSRDASDEPAVVSESHLPPAPTTPPVSDPNADAAVMARPRTVDSVEPITLARPPFEQSAPKPLTVEPAAAPALRQLKAARNQITDDAQWFAHNQLKSRRLRVGGFRADPSVLPPGLPLQLGQLQLVEVFDHGDHRILSFGENFAGGFVLAVQTPDGDTSQVYDLSNYRRAPRAFPGDEQFVDQLVRWAEVRDGVLYVANAHRTYAKSSFQQNAYITALDQKTGELRWRSAPLVANSMTFLIKQGHLISGYGFTAEPDHLFIIDRANGKTVRRIPVASGPNWLIEHNGQLFVRTYDMNYVFSL